MSSRTAPREHGTPKGHRQHRYRGERPCHACIKANTQESSGRATARNKALAQLAKEYRARFIELYYDELRKQGIEPGTGRRGLE